MDDIPGPDDLKLYADVERHSAGTFKVFHAEGIGVEDKIKQHFANFEELAHRIKTAEAAGCLIEVISLRLQVIDYWLRIYFVHHAAGEHRRKKFGALLKQCKALGLADAFYRKLLEFNAFRIKAVHGFVVGATGYSELAAAAQASRNLLIETVEFVVRNSGEPVSNRNDLA